MKRAEIFLSFLNIYPLSHALPRGLESLLFRRLALRAPILDLGCGDGSFALLTFGKGRIDVGIDKRGEDIKKSKSTGVYKKLVIADATKLPFPAKTFNTIISNSVLEHVKDLDKVLKECFQLLSDKGEFIFTVPNKSERNYWFWPKIFGNLYLKIYDRLVEHYNFYDKDIWIKKLKEAGFGKVEVTSYAPQKTVTLLDFFVPFSLFYFLTGKVFGPRKILAKIFLPFFYLDEKTGLGYFFRVKKTGVNI